MNRRELLKAATASTALAMLPGFAATRAFAQAGEKTFTIIPQADLNILDPVWTTAAVVAVYGEAVFDTLYGYDAEFNVHPQMAEGHEVSDDNLTWTITLRDGLLFHDGQPVTAKDCVASIKRWGERDTMGQTLMAAIDDISAKDDKTIVVKLNKPFALLPNALGKSSGNMACIMPERLAKTPAFEQIKEAVGSGPFKFMRDQWVSGSRAVFEKFEDYKPREGNQPASFTAGPKVVNFDKMVWNVISDASTSVAALQSGEVDAIEQVTPDFLPVLRQDPNLQIVPRSIYSFGVMRFNHLQPPFDNIKIRQAVLAAVDQEAFMTAIFGAENSDIWRANVGVFTPGTPMASEAGLDVVKGDHDLEKAKQAVKDAGYDGAPVVVMDPADYPWIHNAALLTADLLKRIGFNVDLQTMDWGTLLQRRTVKGPSSENGWNVFCTGLNGTNNLDPAGQLGLRGNGAEAWFGWPDNPEIEKLRLEWFAAPDLEAQKKIAAQIQEKAMERVPYVPLGAFAQVSVFRKNWTDIPEQMPLFFTMKPASA